jgi:hypothetical protein
MTPEQATQTLAAIINRATFQGSIAEIQTLGAQAQQALDVLQAAIKPIENNPEL